MLLAGPLAGRAEAGLDGGEPVAAEQVGHVVPPARRQMTQCRLEEVEEEDDEDEENEEKNFQTKEGRDRG